MARLVGARPRDLRLQELRATERWYEVAIAQTQRLLDRYDLMPSSEADFALLNALEFQREMMDEYAEVFTQCMLDGEPADEGTPAKPSKPRKRTKVKPLVKAAGSTTYRDLQ